MPTSKKRAARARTTPAASASASSSSSKKRKVGGQGAYNTYRATAERNRMDYVKPPPILPAQPYGYDELTSNHNNRWRRNAYASGRSSSANSYTSKYAKPQGSPNYTGHINVGTGYRMTSQNAYGKPSRLNTYDAYANLYSPPKGTNKYGNQNASKTSSYNTSNPYATFGRKKSDTASPSRLPNWMTKWWN